jgi:hypothetical protein
MPLSYRDYTDQVRIREVQYKADTFINFMLRNERENLISPVHAKSVCDQVRRALHDAGLSGSRGANNIRVDLVSAAVIEQGITQALRKLDELLPDLHREWREIFCRQE